MASNDQSTQIMASPVFRYAVLIILCVVLLVGTFLCYRTRANQRRPSLPIGGAASNVSSVAVCDWGPKPALFDAYLSLQRERPTFVWDEIMPFSVGRGAFDPSKKARISLLVQMPMQSSEPLLEPRPLTDEQQHLPHMEIGLADVNVVAVEAKTSVLDVNETAKKKGS
ncbi:polyketide beta-ketoacyl-synthase [Favolaschia claudopus]|uniref:Polyketide beta-ketoacyl-synthase n=1 Tax=Favolaschia claudopus TaxID=2862362 RepID=A0AAW0DLB4_9AGAR